MINNFNFSREFNLEREKQIIFYTIFLTFKERINGKLIKYNLILIFSKQK